MRASAQSIATAVASGAFGAIGRCEYSTGKFCGALFAGLLSPFLGVLQNRTSTRGPLLILADARSNIVMAPPKVIRTHALHLTLWKPKKTLTPLYYCLEIENCNDWTAGA